LRIETLFSGQGSQTFFQPGGAPGRG
jgi:hypothetical protein